MVAPQSFIQTPKGNLYPDRETEYNQARALQVIAENRDVLDSELVAMIEEMFSSSIKHLGVMGDNTDTTKKTGFQNNGISYIPSGASYGTMVGLPEGLSGPAMFFSFSGPAVGMGFTTHILSIMGTSPALLWRSLRGSNSWNSWVRLDATSGGGGTSDPYEPVAVGLKNADLLAVMRQRKGGPVGIGDRGGFALRLDHGTVAFSDHLSALLKKYGIPATMAVYSKQREINAATNGIAWGIVESWHRTHGLSMGGHSDDHLDKPSASGWYGGTIGSAIALKALMPSVPVEQYIPHGSTGYDRYGGFNLANSHEAIVGTLAGRMAASSHALIAGYRGGRYRTLSGSPMQGLTHWTMEKSDPATFKSVVDAAITDKAGVAVMFHPEFIGTNNAVYMTWAQVEECLAYVAQKRDEGVLVPLTLDGLAFADTRSTHRDDLCRDPRMQSTGSWGVSGFTKTPGAFASSTAGSEVSHSVSLGNKDWALGGVRVAEWKLTAHSASKIIISVSESGGTWLADRTVYLSSGVHVVPNPFGIPLDLTGSLVTKLVLETGSVTVSESHLYAN